MRFDNITTKKNHPVSRNILDLCRRFYQQVGLILRRQIFSFYIDKRECVQKFVEIESNFLSPGNSDGGNISYVAVCVWVLPSHFAFWARYRLQFFPTALKFHI